MTVCRVVVDRTRCAGLGLCEAAMPDVFEVADDGMVRVHGAEVDNARRQELEDAALNCPTQAIGVNIVADT